MKEENEKKKPEKAQGMKSQGQEGDRFFLSVVAYSYYYSSSRPLLLLQQAPSRNTIDPLPPNTICKHSNDTYKHALRAGPWLFGIGGRRGGYSWHWSCKQRSRRSGRCHREGLPGRIALSELNESSMDANSKLLSSPIS